MHVSILLELLILIEIFYSKECLIYVHLTSWKKAEAKNTADWLTNLPAPFLSKGL